MVLQYGPNFTNCTRVLQKIVGNTILVVILAIKYYLTALCQRTLFLRMRKTPDFYARYINVMKNSCVRGSQQRAMLEGQQQMIKNASDNFSA